MLFRSRKDTLSLSARIDLGPWARPGVIENGAPTARTRLSLGFAALVRSIDCGVLPGTVTAVHLSSGDRTQVETTDGLLDEVVDLCAEAITRWAERS